MPDTKWLHEIKIEKPLTREEMNDFRVFYFKGTIHVYNPINSTDMSLYLDCSVENESDERWNIQGYHKYTENGKSQDGYYGTGFYGSHIYTPDLMNKINPLVEQGGTVVGYKSASKMKGLCTSAPSRRAAPKKRTPAVKVNVRKMF